MNASPKSSPKSLGACRRAVKAEITNFRCEEQAGEQTLRKIATTLIKTANLEVGAEA